MEGRLWALIHGAIPFQIFGPSDGCSAHISFPPCPRTCGNVHQKSGGIGVTPGHSGHFFWARISKLKHISWVLAEIFCEECLTSLKIVWLILFPCWSSNKSGGIDLTLGHSGHLFWARISKLKHISWVLAEIFCEECLTSLKIVWLILFLF
jgi:hypothetical protein